jgi:hypothetical protein
LEGVEEAQLAQFNIQGNISPKEEKLNPLQMT